MSTDDYRSGGQTIRQTDYNNKHGAAIVQLAEVFGEAVQNACVWVLTRVAQIVTDADRDL